MRKTNQVDRFESNGVLSCVMKVGTVSSILSLLQLKEICVYVVSCTCVKQTNKHSFSLYYHIIPLPPYRYLSISQSLCLTASSICVSIHPSPSFSYVHLYHLSSIFLYIYLTGQYVIQPASFPPPPARTAAWSGHLYLVSNTPVAASAAAIVRLIEDIGKLRINGAEENGQTNDHSA